MPRIALESDIIAARQEGRALAARLGFSTVEQTLIATAISELARNIVTYARVGEIVISTVSRNGRNGIMVVARDQGPGILNIDKAMEDGFSTSGSLGLGLPGVKRLMDEFEISSVAGKGTLVTARKWVPAAAVVPAAGEAPLVDWAVSDHVLPGQAVSGDKYLVRPFQDGVLVAVLDGLGHGQEAAEAAEAAVSIMNANPGQTLVSLVGRCHEALLGTRGVALSAASFRARDGLMSWMGVGNVEGLLLGRERERSGREGSRQESLLLRSGVVGYRLPSLSASTLSVRREDILIFVTDGISSDFARDINLNGSVQQIADRILLAHSRGTDDALVLVVRYLGENEEEHSVAVEAEISGRA